MHYVKWTQWERLVFDMNRIWANRLEAGDQLWQDCPEGRKTAVKQIMRQDVQTGRGGMTTDRYEQITGEPYVSSDLES